MTVDGTHHAIVASGLVDELVSEALVWISLHGLVVGDRSIQVAEVQFKKKRLVLTEERKGTKKVHILP
ncbi:uncharacterized protein A4U43_C07F35790 [Asparagus officinalis]|uniref:Uncharacterized protein n=1 Tax=Asparagus officinalis TaxID=4686 RepID=A0A5P1EHA2_ASPOF|nr:uncharacterized protein A4U43_C07F35790 [Asparagus officinalis]